MERVIRDFILKNGMAAFRDELRKVMADLGEPDFLAGRGLQRRASETEVVKLFTDGMCTDDDVKRPVPCIIRDHGCCYVAAMGEVILVSELNELNQETTEAINDFCKEKKWTYEVLSNRQTVWPEAPPTIVFKTGFFVNPA